MASPSSSDRKEDLDPGTARFEKISSSDYASENRAREQTQPEERSRAEQSASSRKRVSFQESVDRSGVRRIPWTFQAQNVASASSSVMHGARYTSSTQEDDHSDQQEGKLDPSHRLNWNDMRGNAEQMRAAALKNYYDNNKRVETLHVSPMILNRIHDLHETAAPGTRRIYRYRDPMSYSSAPGFVGQPGDTPDASETHGSGTEDSRATVTYPMRSRVEDPATVSEYCDSSMQPFYKLCFSESLTSAAASDLGSISRDQLLAGRAAHELVTSYIPSRKSRMVGRISESIKIASSSAATQRDLASYFTSKGISTNDNKQSRAVERDTSGQETITSETGTKWTPEISVAKTPLPRRIIYSSETPCVQQPRADCRTAESVSRAGASRSANLQRNHASAAAGADRRSIAALRSGGDFRDFLGNGVNEFTGLRPRGEADENFPVNGISIIHEDEQTKCESRGPRTSTDTRQQVSQARKQRKNQEHWPQAEMYEEEPTTSGRTTSAPTYVVRHGLSSNYNHSSTVRKIPVVEKFAEIPREERHSKIDWPSMKYRELKDMAIHGLQSSNADKRISFAANAVNKGKRKTSVKQEPEKRQQAPKTEPTSNIVHLAKDIENLRRTLAKKKHNVKKLPSFEQSSVDSHAFPADPEVAALVHKLRRDCWYFNLLWNFLLCSSVFVGLGIAILVLLDFYLVFFDKSSVS